MNGPLSTTAVILGIQLLGAIVAQTETKGDPLSLWLDMILRYGGTAAVAAWLMLRMEKKTDAHTNSIDRLARGIWTLIHDNTMNPRIREDAKKEVDDLNAVINKPK